MPDAFLIGTPRAATTSFYRALGDHPSIYAPALKEACFTCPDIDPGQTQSQTRYFSDEAEYLQLFAASGPEQLVLEGCMYNIYSPRAPGLIRALNGAARLLVQLRDPIEQMYSNHALKLIMVDSTRTFENELEVQADVRGDRAGQPLNMRDYDLRDKAIAAPGLRRFIDEFGRDRIHVSLYEDFATDAHSVLRSAFRFLGVDEGHVATVGVHVPNRVARSDTVNRTMASQRVIAGAKSVVPDRLHPVARRLVAAAFRLNRRRVQRAPLDPALRDRLRAEFRAEVAELSDLTGIDLHARWWSAPPKPLEPSAGAR